MSGSHITPVSERHVLNIHLNFKSGIPTVEDIHQPDIILPGTALSMPDPYVTPGAYEITGGGWKLFETESDAESHINGIEYTNSEQPLYLYQDKYHLAYYTKTYLGETYSNHVPVSVANYHDLKKVMDAKDHHYYIDHKDVHERLKVEPKIYINDYSGSSENGLDLFKDLYDLSLLNNESTGVSGGKVTTEGSLKDHNLLNDRVKGGKNLEFFLRTDLSHADAPAVANEWTSIASGSDPCFQGTLHGDGHTISGLDNSLFGHLCGSVYNLGVTGSFNTAGVADDGDGYVESCWVKTTSVTPLGTKPYPVFGAPSDNNGYQVVNSYFWDGNKSLYQDVAEGSDVTYSEGSKGAVRAMTAEEFYNGTVAYDLNNFYLYKRYSDQKVTTGTEKQKYSYFTIGDDGKLVLQNNHYYDAHTNLCSTGHEDKGEVIMYVEDRFADGDFRYAGGTIPAEEDERFHTWTVTDPDTGKETAESCFFPIWPDDYIFFGQKLTYGWAVEAHQDVPTAVVRDGGRLSMNNDANRVYRAPAYYRSKVMNVAHFNPQAYLAQTKKNDPATLAYPNMTAIDFKGFNENDYQLGLNGGLFYTPLLDDDGLVSIQNCDETQNLLAYAPAEGDNKKTHDVLNGYFMEPVYNDYYTRPDDYRLVSEAPAATVHGHLVQSDQTATNDHLLVDKQDFNAPIDYTFNGSHLMWYQRMPADNEYVDLKMGWQGISLPFTAELVTTDTKGEITHFFGGSTKGHEYWLREFDDVSIDDSEPNVAKATFQYPAASEGVDYREKRFKNTFLWDYYYKNENIHNQLDKNSDTYLEYRQYYKDSHTYYGYSSLKAATPYILGLPGVTYYEFDLSGEFEAQNTAVAIPKIRRQWITFASNNGEHIGVSDDEMAGKEVTYKGVRYIFKPNYLNESLTAGTDHYTLKAEYDSDNDGEKDCSTFAKVTGDATQVAAFRPFFMSEEAPGGTRTVERIDFIQKEDNVGVEEQHGDPTAEELNGGLRIWTKKDKIYVESSLSFTEDMRVVTPAGVTVATFSVKPGKTVGVQADFSGMYIVHTLDGKYTKKVTVKK